MVDSSVFISGGQLNQALGYDQRLLYHPLRDMEAPRVGPRPSLTEVDQAKGLSNDDVLVDFRLVDDAKRAHAVALFLLPFVRALIDGRTPIHLIYEPAAGTGGMLLAKVVLQPAVWGVSYS